MERVRGREGGRGGGDGAEVEGGREIGKEGEDGCRRLWEEGEQGGWRRRKNFGLKGGRRKINE